MAVLLDDHNARFCKEKTLTGQSAQENKSNLESSAIILGK